MKLSVLHTWRNVIGLGYFPLESFISTENIADECIINVDPTFPDDVALAEKIAEKYDKTRVVRFIWPANATGDGSRIGIASNFTLAQATGDWCLNVQCDEAYPEPLSAYMQKHWRQWAKHGIDGFNLKILHTHHNCSEFQGGEQWDGDRESEVWHRGGMMNASRTLGGAGYNKSIKLFRRCPAIKFKPDAWSMSGCATVGFIAFSQIWPIIHMHDHFRDSLVALRQTAANEIWTDRERYGDYARVANELESTQDKWWNDPRWTQTVSPFDELLPEIVKPLIGQTHYVPRLELLES